MPIDELALHDAVAQTEPGLLLAAPVTGVVMIALELPLASGRPDVVIADVDIATMASRRRAGLAPCTAPWPAAVALAVRQLGGAASVDLVARRLRQAGPARVRSAARVLTGHGILSDSSTAELQLSTEWSPSLIRVAAVEAKLRDWPRAVRQAQKWETSVDGAWLAFPRQYLRRVPREPGLRRFGLLAVSDATASPTRRPRAAMADPLRRVLLEEALYARWLDHTGSENPEPPSDPVPHAFETRQGRGIDLLVSSARAGHRLASWSLAEILRQIRR